MRVHLTLPQLEAFVRVASLGNFRAAAQSLFVSQPALSRTIRIAEELVGARLFDRDTRHVALTAAGHELLPIARRIVGEFDDAFSELSQFMEGRSGRITVAALPSAGVALLPQAIAAFRRERGQVEFLLQDASASPLLNRINDGSADIGITVKPPPDPRFAFTPLLLDEFVLVCRQDDALAAQPTARWSAFESRPFIASSLNSSIRPLTEAVFLEQGLAVRPAFECANIAIIGALVDAGLGISAVPRLALRLLDARTLAAIPLGSPKLGRQIGIVTRTGRSLSPAAQAFIEQLKASASGLAPAGEAPSSVI